MTQVYTRNEMFKRKNIEYMSERHNQHLFSIVHRVISHFVFFKFLSGCLASFCFVRMAEFAFLFSKINMIFFQTLSSEWLPNALNVWFFFVFRILWFVFCQTLSYGCLTIVLIKWRILLFFEHNDMVFSSNFCLPDCFILFWPHCRFLFFSSNTLMCFVPSNFRMASCCFECMSDFMTETALKVLIK